MHPRRGPRRSRSVPGGLLSVRVVPLDLEQRHAQLDGVLRSKQELTTLNTLQISSEISIDELRVTSARINGALDRALAVGATTTTEAELLTAKLAIISALADAAAVEHAVRRVRVGEDGRRDELRVERHVQDGEHRVHDVRLGPVRRGERRQPELQRRDLRRVRRPDPHVRVAPLARGHADEELLGAARDRRGGVRRGALPRRRG